MQTYYYMSWSLRSVTDLKKYISIDRSIDTHIWGFSLTENQNTQYAPTWSVFGRVVEKAEAEQQEDDCSPGDFS